MNGIRVYQLAKELNISSNELMEKLKANGVEVSSHMKVLDEKTCKLVADIFGKEKKPKAKKLKAEQTENAGKPEKPVTAAPKKKPAEKKKPKEKAEVKEKAKPEVKTEGKKEETPDLHKPKKETKKEIVAEVRKEVKEKPKEKPKEEEKPKPEPKKEILPVVVKEPVKAAPAPVPEKKENLIELSDSITVKELSEKIKKEPKDIIKRLITMGVMASINQIVDIETAKNIANEFGYEVEVSSAESELLEYETKDDESKLQPRPPVVTIMGHVDHGKTSLLDAIRQTNVIDGESGGITQHIGAYHVELSKGNIVFLDTPGHQAFTAMRARGAQVTDIVVLVVAADDGVMPQTVEAINHAKAANVPIIVAVNKIDKPNADATKVRQALTEYNIVPEEWGGENIFIDVSAKKRTGIENLLEMILLQAEMLELKANPSRKVVGTVIEAKLDRGRGPVATILIRAGTLKIGDPFVTGVHWGKVRAMINDEGKKVHFASPSIPVEVLGFSGVPHSGDSFIVVDDEKRAKQISLLREHKQREASLSKSSKITLEDLYNQIKQGSVKELKIILKADVQGSVQALRDSLEKLSTNSVKLDVIHAGTGGVTETDVILASASNAIIIGFHIRPEIKASQLAEKEGINMRFYSIIYDIVNDIKAAMEGLLDPIYKEKVIGRAEVRELFNIPKIGTISGSYVIDGKIARSSQVRLIRDNVVIYEGKISSLRRFKDDAKEVLTGYECGIGIENFNDIKLNDIIESYIMEKFAAKL